MAQTALSLVVDSLVQQLASGSAGSEEELAALVDESIASLPAGERWAVQDLKPELLQALSRLQSPHAEHGAASKALGTIPSHHVTAASPGPVILHAAAAQAAGHSSRGLAAMILAGAVDGSQGAGLPELADSACDAIGYLTLRSVWKDSVPSRRGLLCAVVQRVAAVVQASLAALTGQGAGGEKPTATPRRSKKRLRETQEPSHDAIAAVHACVPRVLRRLVSGLASATSAAALGQAGQTAQCPVSAAQAHDSRVAALFAMVPLLQHLAACSAAVPSSAAKVARTGEHATPPPSTTTASPGLPPLLHTPLLVGRGRSATLQVLCAATSAACDAVASDKRWKALALCRGAVAQAAWMAFLAPAVARQESGGDWAGPWGVTEYLALLSAVRSVTRVTYHILKAARKAGGGVADTLPVYGRGPGVGMAVPTLQSAVQAALEECLPPPGLVHWAQGVMLQGGEEEEAAAALAVLAQGPENSGGLLHRKRVPDSAVRALQVLARGGGFASGYGAAADAASLAGGSSDDEGSVDGEEEEEDDEAGADDGAFVLDTGALED